MQDRIEQNEGKAVIQRDFRVVPNAKERELEMKPEKALPGQSVFSFNPNPVQAHRNNGHNICSRNGTEGFCRASCEPPRLDGKLMRQLLPLPCSS